MRECDVRCDSGVGIHKVMLRSSERYSDLPVIYS